MCRWPRIDTYEPLPVYKPAAAASEKALDMLAEPLIAGGGGVVDADASDLWSIAELTGAAGDPHADGLGCDPDDHP